MNGLYKYSDLTTKILAMRGKMLDKKNYEAMLNKADVTEVALYLKNETNYGQIFKDLQENEVHRGNLESLLYRSIIQDANKISKHLSGDERKAYNYVYRKLDIENVKRLLRTVSMGETFSDVDMSSFFRGKYSQIDFEKALKATSVDNLIETMKDTDFYGLLKPLVSRRGQIDLFQAETVLDMYYYQKTAQDIKRVSSKEDRSCLTKYFGMEADLKNIFWIYRSKKYYHLNRELVYRYLLSGSYKLSRRILNDMVDASSIEDFVDVVKRTYYGDVLDFDSAKIEIQALSYTAKIQKSMMRKEPFSIAPVIGYMHLKEIEILNITNIVEGIRYQVEPENIKTYLAGVYRREEA